MNLSWVACYRGRLANFVPFTGAAPHDTLLRVPEIYVIYNKPRILRPFDEAPPAARASFVDECATTNSAPSPCLTALDVSKLAM